MKITRGRKFEPITIVLETVEEATAMYAQLNCSVTSAERDNPSLKIDGDLSQQLFNAFSSVFYPKGDC